MYLCKMITGIYTITNIINNKIYVGKSKNIKYRFTEHLKCLENNKHHNIYLQNAFNKYGKEAFKLEILEECDITFIFSQENYWCNLLNTHNRSFGYNIRPTNPYNNCKISKESKIKMSVNKHFNAKVRGYYYTKETVEKACIKRRKAILQYDLEMNFIKEWDTIGLAAT